MTRRHRAILMCLLVTLLMTAPARGDQPVTTSPALGTADNPTIGNTSDGRRFAVWQTNDGGVGGVSFSINQGGRWGADVKIDVPAGFTQLTSPSLTIDRNNNIIISYVAVGPTFSALFVTVIPQGQTTPGFTSKVSQVNSPSTIAYQQAACDLSPLSANVYTVTEVDPQASPGAGGAIFFSRSTDGGLTWSTPMTISNASAGNFSPSLAVSPSTGRIDVLWSQSSGTAGIVLDATSTDGGNTFTPQSPVRTAFLGPLPPPPIGAAPDFDLANGGTLIIGVKNCVGSNSCRIEVSRLVNGIWQAPQSFGVGTLDQQFPVVRTGPPNVVALGYAELTGVGPLYNIVIQHSTNNGGTFQRLRANDVGFPNVHLFRREFDFEIFGFVSQESPRDIVPGTTVFPVWTGPIGGGGTAIFTTGTAPGNVLVAAVLPTSRSVQVSNTATAFVTVINTGTTPATAVRLSLITPIPATFSYQTTDAANVPTGSPNTPVDIPPGGAQAFVIAITPNGPFPPSDVALAFAGDNTVPVATIIGVNTLLGSASATAVPDIVALAATPRNDGIAHIAGANGNSAFAVATANVGIGGDITVSADTGGASPPVVLNVCQTDSGTGQCIAAPASSVVTHIAAGGTPTFGVFISGTGVVPFDPANNRAFVRFKQSGVTRGSTSVALETD